MAGSASELLDNDIVYAIKAKQWDNNAQPQHITTACATSHCMSFISRDSEVKMRLIVIFCNSKHDIVHTECFRADAAVRTFASS